MRAVILGLVDSPRALAALRLTAGAIFALLMLAAAFTAQAAPEITLTPTVTQMRGQAAVTLAWSVEGADSCDAFGSWSGVKPLAGSEDMGVIATGATYGLRCVQNAETSVELSWVPATSNTDGSPYVDPLYTIFKMRFDDGPLAWDTECNGPVRCVQINDAPGARPTEHEVTGFTEEGTIKVTAFHMNQNMVMSDPSNVASKVLASEESSESVSVVVNPLPAAPSGLTLN